MTEHAERPVASIDLIWHRWVLRHQKVWWLAATFVAAMLVSRGLGPDGNWDLRNYHYYNGRSIVTGTFLHDVAPAGAQSYLNPVIDVPIYLFTQTLGPVRGLVIWAAIAQWCCYLAVWRLTGAFKTLRTSAVLRVAALVLALTGSAAASLAFTTFGDWIVAALLCEATTHAMSWVRERQDKQLMFSGLWMGLAVSVKMTAGTFVFAMVIACAVAFGVRATWRVLTGTAIGLGMLGLPWMVILTARYGSPVFPFYNTIFHAGSAPASNFDDARFGATSARDILTFPVDMIHPSIKFGELPIADWRFAGLLVLIAVFTLCSSGTTVDRCIESIPVRWFVTMSVIAFPLWIVVFGYYRYFLFAELVCSIAIVIIVALLVSSTSKAVVIIAATVCFAISAQSIPNWGRGDMLTNPQLTTVIAQRDIEPRYVVFVGPPPFGNLTQNFSSSTRFASMFAYDSNELRLAGDLRDDLADLIESGLQDGSLYIVKDVIVTALPAALKGLSPRQCAPFTAVDRSLELCHMIAS